MLSFFCRYLKVEKGFSLIEVLVVVAIIAILAAIAVPMILGRVSQARESSDLALSRSLENTLAMYLVDKDFDPDMDAVSLNDTGYLDDLSLIWKTHGTKYLDQKTIDYLTENFSDNKITGRVLLITYDSVTGFFSTGKIVADD